MAPWAQIQPQAAGSDDEFINIDHAFGSNLNSDTDDAPIALPKVAIPIKSV